MLPRSSTLPALDCIRHLKAFISSLIHNWNCNQIFITRACSNRTSLSRDDMLASILCFCARPRFQLWTALDIYRLSNYHCYITGITIKSSLREHVIVAVEHLYQEMAEHWDKNLEFAETAALLRDNFHQEKVFFCSRPQSLSGVLAINAVYTGKPKNLKR